MAKRPQSGKKMTQRQGSRPAKSEIRGVRFDPTIRPKLDRDDDSNEEFTTAGGGNRRSAGNAGTGPQTRKDARNEVKVCGVHACHAVFAQRRDAIIRAYVTDDRLKEFSQMLSWAAAERKAYHVVTAEDLDRIAGTVHHEGVCLLTKQGKSTSAPELLLQLSTRKGPQCIVLLEKPHNPHNLGAFVRVAAHFGAAAIVVGGEDLTVTAAAYRTAEGGFEFLPVALTPHIEGFLQAAKKEGYALVATSGRGNASIYDGELPRRTVILFGPEREGLSPGVMKRCDRVLKIPGTGNVESLNLSCAGAVVLGEWRRQFPV